MISVGIFSLRLVLNSSYIVDLRINIFKMTAFTIAPCSLADSAALSRNNMSAFWEIPNWVLAWRHTTLEKHIDTMTKRYPRRLISHPETSRHQKVVDSETGRLLGYARWLLPESHTRLADGEPVWPEAMAPVVSPEEEAAIKRVAEATQWNPNSDTDPLDDAVGAIKDKIMARKPYLCLDYLAVHPENKGKGVATLLVESGMQQAGKLGLDIFILACKPGWGLYSRLGFRVEEELVQDDSIYGGDGEFAMRYYVYEQPLQREA
ncbi:acetyltransferase [Trichoderma gamsii]|uniref:Acetyltransferase n=1 Tax=Trichoderma gamsii TaxID=398673 RepID=A0A2P4ZSC9_9HYPO|nr:acetyltransferase [Trichoderma gamsii]PON27153.1 acetyltransferase [Trichoderma gamsii]